MEGFPLFDDNHVMTVKSHKWEYEVRKTVDLKDQLGSELILGDFLLVDKNIARLHSKELKGFFDDYNHIFIEPTEKQKSYQQIEPIIEWLIKKGLKRNNRLIAIGGGITQDICAFISSILYRGVSWIFVPTTLLAQADSCIGSKTSINFGSYKNQIGSFHPPVLILLSNNFLLTLSKQDIRSGLGEIIHYFLVSGRKDMERLSTEYSASFNEPEIMMGLIQRSLEIKKNIIEIDEFDQGPRNIFNYGHSFGHALESYTNFNIPHGVAVSFGMDIANYLSVELGFMRKAEAIEMQKILQKNWWPIDFPKVDVTVYMKLLSQDKKNIGSKYRLVLAKGVGNMFVHTIEDDSILRFVLKERFDYYFKNAIFTKANNC